MDIYRYKKEIQDHIDKLKNDLNNTKDKMNIEELKDLINKLKKELDSIEEDLGYE